MPKLPEGFEIIDTQAASLPQGFNILTKGAEKQEKFAMQTDPRNPPEGFQVVQDPVIPDAFGSELRAPKPLEGVTRAIKGAVGVPLAAAGGVYNELVANTPRQIGQLMETTEDITGANIFGNMPEQLQIQGNRAEVTPERLSAAENLAREAGGAAGSSLKSISMRPGGAGLAYGGLEFSDVYNDARDQGRTKAQSIIAALPAGVFNYVLEYAGVERLLKGPEIKAGTSALKRAAINIGYGGAVEGLEEGSQTVSTDWVKEMNNLQDETLTQLSQKVLKSMALGAIGGASSRVILSKLEQSGAKEVFKAAGMDDQQAQQAVGKLAIKIQEEAKNVPQPVTQDVSAEQQQIQAGVQEQDQRQQRYVATVEKAVADGLNRDQANDVAVGMLNNTAVTPQDETAYLAHYKNALVAGKMTSEQAVQYADMKIRNAKIVKEQQQQPAPVNVPEGFEVVGGGIKAGGRMHQISPQEKAQAQKVNAQGVEFVTLNRDITVKNLSGETKTYKKGEDVAIYQDPQTGKAVVKDGDYGVLPKNSVTQVRQASNKPFAMEEGVQEVVKGGQGFEGRHRRMQELITRENNGTITPDEVRELDELEPLVNQGTQGKDETKFSQYQLPGGENYREVLLTAPPVGMAGPRIIKYDSIDRMFRAYDSEGNVVGEAKTQDELQGDIATRAGNFKSSHWDEPNVLAHLRVNDRVTPDGKKVLFLEELQSDWAREARSAGEQNKIEISTLEKNLQDYYSQLKELDLNGRGDSAEAQVLSERAAQTETRIMEKKRNPKGIPQNEKLKNWQELALKRAIKEAVDKDYDYIAWTTGEQQAERYDLSKQADVVRFTKNYDNSGITIHVDKGGNTLLTKENISAEELPSVVGKDLAKKILDSDANGGKFSGVDLKIGGEWAKNLYDKQIPNILKDLTKGEVGMVKIDTHRIGETYQVLDDNGRVIASTANKAEAERMAKNSDLPATVKTVTSQLQSQPALRITPKIKRMVIGQPMAGGKASQVNTYDTIKERLSETKNIKNAIPHLEQMGQKVWQEGHQNFAKWQLRMKEVLGDMWGNFKSAMKVVFDRVRKWWEAQGRLGIVAPGFETPGGKRKKLSSIIKKLGGLDPKKLSKDYNLKDLKGDGLLNVMRNGGWALDEIVDRLQAEGVVIPEDVNPSDWVIEELKRQAGKKVEKSLESKFDEMYNKAAERAYENEKAKINREIEKYGHSNAEIIEAERDLEADFEAAVGREGVQEEAVSPAIYFSDEELAILKQQDLPLPAPIANRIYGERKEGASDLIPGIKLEQPVNAPPIGRGGIQAPAMSDEEQGKAKRRGIFWLSRETFRRNIERIFPKDVAARINQYASDKVMRNEYERVTWTNKIRTETAALLKKLGIGLYDKLDTPIVFENEAGDKIRITTLDSAIQAYGEKQIDQAALQKATRKWQEVIQASEHFRNLYNQILDKWNASMRSFGYQPVPKRKDYFRHLKVMGGVLDEIGFIFKSGDLPTAIAGLTEWFKPGRPFTTAQMKRLGVRTDYSAIQGFDNYLNSVSQQIYHTDSVQRIRMLEAYIRNIDPQGTKLSAFVTYLREYGNLLAGKTSVIDRSIEGAFIGRKAIQTMNWIKKRTGANMISANISAAMTNLIPLFTQLPTIVSPAALSKGLYEGTISPIKADFATIDGVKSSFLTRRFPTKEIFKTRGQKVGNALGFFFETVDAYTSAVATASMYYNNLAKGMSKEDAMRQADIDAGKLITDRSFGQLPNMFASKLLGPITQFQVEVNNMTSWISRDLKIAHGGDPKKYAAALALFFMLSFMFNSIYEKLTGRRPTIDPIHATLILIGMDDQAYKSKEGVKRLKSFGERAKTATKDLAENLPFGNTLMKFFGGGSGGRLPIEAAIPKGFSIKELSKPVYNVALPMAGGQARKSLDGITAYATGGKFNSFGAYLDYQLGGEAKKPKFKVEQTPANLAKMAVFGPSASEEAKKYYAGR